MKFLKKTNFIQFSLHNLTHLGFIIYRTESERPLVWLRTGEFYDLKLWWNIIYEPNTKEKVS